MSDAPGDGTAPAGEPPLAPRPPLWRPAARQPATRVQMLVIGMVCGMAAMMAFMYFEPQFFTTPATPLPLTITSIEGTSHADKETSPRLTYQVTLPDGTRTRFSSARIHPPGTRILAMVSRGRVTGRVIVTAPYSVLPE